MRTLVTGGAGFIGSHVVEGRLAAGDSVVVLDDLSTGRRENLSGLEVDLRVADLRDPAALESALEGVEGIVHLAGFVSVPGSIADPVTSAEVNILGTVRLIEAARRAGTRRIVFASSAATSP